MLLRQGERGKINAHNPIVGRCPPRASTAPRSARPRRPPTLRSLPWRSTPAGGRARELAAVPAVILVSGDDLILRKNGKRVVATVIPPDYHALKCIAHSVLALFGNLSQLVGQPLGLVKAFLRDLFRRDLFRVCQERAGRRGPHLAVLALPLLRYLLLPGDSIVKIPRHTRRAATLIPLGPVHELPDLVIQFRAGPSLSHGPVEQFPPLRGVLNGDQDAHVTPR